MSKRLFNYIARADGGATVLLYGDVGPWGDITSERVVSELLALEGQFTTIDVHINSNGGDVFSGIAIYNALRQSKADITIYIDGLAASIAGVIALCGKPLYMSQYARLMLHKVSGGAYGSARELRETATLIEGLEQSLAEMIASRAKLTSEEVHSRYFADGEDHWLTAQEALALGMIDGIHDLDDSPQLSGASTTDEIYQAFNNRLESKAKPKTIDMALLDDIKTIPSLSNATETNAVSLIREQATKLEVLAQANASLQARLDELEAREVENILATAIADGRITEAQKPSYEALLRSDRTNTEALLASLPKAQRGGSFSSARQFTQSTPSGTKNKYQGKTWDQLDREGLLAQYKDEDPEGFASAFKAEFGADYQF